ncbi:MAG: NUDIX hydrolase [Parcubacteria group bacterium]|nr:NUDIX hydrolase [Parcubacteria group bacterium]
MQVHNPDYYNVALKIILKNKKGKILVLKNAEETGEGDYYDMPGGRINTDEFTTPYETLIDRELKEEIGGDVKYKLSLDPVSFGRHEYFSVRQKKEIRVFYLLFEAEYIAGVPIVSHEHSGYKWLRLENIPFEKYFIKGMLESVKRYAANQKS